MLEYTYPKETKRMKTCTGKVDFLTCLSHCFTNFSNDRLSWLRGVAVDPRIMFGRPRNVNDYFTRNGTQFEIYLFRLFLWLI